MICGGGGHPPEQQVPLAQLLLGPALLNELVHAAHEQCELAHIGIIIFLLLIADCSYDGDLSLIHDGNADISQDPSLIRREVRFAAINGIVIDDHRSTPFQGLAPEAGLTQMICHLAPIRAILRQGIFGPVAHENDALAFIHKGEIAKSRASELCTRLNSIVGKLLEEGFIHRIKLEQCPQPRLI